MRVVVSTGHFSLLVHVPLSTYEVLPAAGQDVCLLTHLLIREDEWRLFGFMKDEEREVFRALLRVSGVGPTTALALLSGFPAGELSRSVAESDILALTRVKGVGKKTAERIVVELRDVFAAGLEGGGTLKAEPGTRAEIQDALAALLALGFDPKEAQRRVKKAVASAPGDGDGGEDGGEDVSEIVRRALRG